jgi:putative SOS response-associated peptidase YedK
MCGRFTLHASPEAVADLLELAAPPILAPRYNIAPTQPVGIVRVEGRGGPRRWALVHWGLIPAWSKDPGIGARMINARAETVAEKPSFRAAWRRRRCLVPADGFYEWQRGEKGKQPFYIRRPDQALFAFAGLWERWVGADGSELESCTVLTTEPNALMAAIHNRMPVILEPADFADWLGHGGDATPQELEKLQHLLRPYPAELLEAVPVSRYVNNPRHEGAACIAVGEG